MPTIQFKLKHKDDAHVEDTWKVYYAFVGRYYQRQIDSQAGFLMMTAYNCYDAWTVPFTQDEMLDVTTLLSCTIFTAIFEWHIKEDANASA